MAGRAGFKGAMWMGDAARDLYCMRARWHDPNTGRFLSEDPIGLAGGLNLYGFASGDPINFSDPFGLCPRITIDGDDVLIEADLRLKEGEPQDATLVREGIQEYWGGRVAGHNVTIKLDVPGAPVVTLEIQKGPIATSDGTRDGGGGSAGRGGRGLIRLRSGMNAHDSRYFGAHEFGHVMEIDHTEDKDDLMYPNPTGGVRVSATSFQQALARCGDHKEQ